MNGKWSDQGDRHDDLSPNLSSDPCPLTYSYDADFRCDEDWRNQFVEIHSPWTNMSYDTGPPRSDQGDRHDDFNWARLFESAPFTYESNYTYKDNTSLLYQYQNAADWRQDLERLRLQPLDYISPSANITYIKISVPAVASESAGDRNEEPPSPNAIVEVRPNSERGGP